MEIDASELVPIGEAVSIARLLGEVAGFEGDVNARKRLLMERLKELTDADGWLWSMTYCDHSNVQPMSVGVIHDGLTGEQFSGWLDASQIAKSPPPEDQHLGKQLAEDKHFTRTRNQLVSDAEWYNHPTVKKYRFERGIDDFLYSLFPLGGPDMCSAIGLFRHVGREPFSARHRRITHIILNNVEWLHHAGLPEHRENSIPELTPTQRIVLIHLLDGKRRADIARLLDVSENTVKSHTKHVLQFYACSDQLELVCRFTAGNGNDISASS